MSELLTQAKTDTNVVKFSKPLLVINADTKNKLDIAAIDRTKERLADFAALKETLQGDILDWNDIAAHRWSRWAAKFLGKGVTLATMAFLKKNKYQIFYCDSENNGLVLALWFKLTFTRRALFMIGHWVTPSKKAVLFKRLRTYTHISTIFLHSTAQYNKTVNELGLPTGKVELLPYQVDTEFWRIENAHPAEPKPDELPYICTAGLEFRDYPTLVKAVWDLPVRLKIGAASHWSKRKNSLSEISLPRNIEVSSYNYRELRDLYAGSSFVVVPLYDTDFQAGITVILEAMAMGKAVIVTRSEGQSDTVVDRRKTLRLDNSSTGELLDTSGQFVQLFNSSDLEPSFNGFYVKPGDPDALRNAIKYLLEHPQEAERMGKAGREIVENLLTVEHFAERIKKVIENKTAPFEYAEKMGNNGANYLKAGE